MRSNAPRSEPTKHRKRGTRDNALSLLCFIFLSIYPAIFMQRSPKNSRATEAHTGVFALVQSGAAQLPRPSLRGQGSPRQGGAIHPNARPKISSRTQQLALSCEGTGGSGRETASVNSGARSRRRGSATAIPRAITGRRPKRVPHEREIARGRTTFRNERKQVD